MGVLTPGLQYLFRLAPTVLAPGIITHYILKFLAKSIELSIPSWFQRMTAIFTLPLWLYAKSIYTEFSEEREANALGALRIPELKGRWPGNLDMLVGRLKHGQDGYPFDNLDPMVRRFGKLFNMKILGENRIIACAPEHIKSMLATNAQNWEKGIRFKRQNYSVLGSGVFNVDGEMWQFHRSMTRPFLSRERVTDFEVFGSHADEALEIIRTRGVGSSSAVDFQDIMCRFTLDTSVEFLFGSTANSLQALRVERGTPEQEKRRVQLENFDKAFVSLQHRLAQRSRSAPLWPLFEIFEDRTAKDMKVVRDFINPTITQALERKRTLFVAGSEKTMLDHLVGITDDQMVIADECLNLLFAGRDTTATVVTFVTYFLAMYPNVHDRLRKEASSVIGSISRHPTIDDIQQMKYLRAVINETLRLFPPVPGTARIPVQSCMLPPTTPGGKPYYVPAGSKVPFAIMHMHRSKELWGEDADEFDPDRFLDERYQKFLVPKPFIFLPFSAGPRICLGKQFAYNESSFFLARLVQIFGRVSIVEDAMPPEAKPPAVWATGTGRKSIEKIRPKSDLTMYVQGGLWLRFEEA